jgi:hypothetical protein
MKNLYLIQPNYSSIINDKTNYWLPYSVAILWSYASQFDEITSNYLLKKIVYRREDIEELAKTIIDGSVIAYSNYIWNWEYNKQLAKTIKKYAPNCLNVFGGPQVSNRPFETNFFKNHPYVDSIILAEGEQSFVDCLTNFTNGHQQKIYTAKRLQDLDIPSPYLNGLFDQLVLENPNAIWNTTVETNRGCPFACTFCDWGSLTYSKIKKFEITRVYHELEWIGKNRVDYLMFADANFGIFKERDFKIAEKICEIKQQYGYPSNLNITFTKNSNPHVVEIVKLFNKSNLSRGMTISFQSMDDNVLKDIKRDNMDINNATEIFSLLDQNQLTHYSELILGLPSETLITWKKGLIKLISIGQHQCIDVFHAMMLENSEINHPAYKEKFKIHEVTVNNFMNVNFVSDNNIFETMNIVRATSTMSPDELIDAFMFSWLIVNFHSYGWTQIYSRFLNNQYKLSYEEFYDSLLDEVTSDQLGIISTFYKTYQSRLKIYLDDNKLFGKKEYNQDILRDVQQYFHQHKDDIEELLKIFVVNMFGNLLSQDIFINLVKYQKHFVASKDKIYPYLDILDLGIQDVIVNNQPYNSNNKKCIIDLTGKFANDKEFLLKLLTWRRNGWGKTIINEKGNN